MKNFLIYILFSLTSFAVLATDESFNISINLVPLAQSSQEEETAPLKKFFFMEDINSDLEPIIIFEVNTLRFPNTRSGLSRKIKIKIDDIGAAVFYVRGSINTTIFKSVVEASIRMTSGNKSVGNRGAGILVDSFKVVSPGYFDVNGNMKVSVAATAHVKFYHLPGKYRGNATLRVTY